MKHFRKIWSPDLNDWLKNTKGMNPKEAYTLFSETFPDIKDVTYVAFKNQRSRVGAAKKVKPHSTKIKPLYAEQEKKGYIRIKVAQPNVWKQKSRWVYEETHPWEDFTEQSHYIFLDGNNRNFHPENIARVPLKLMPTFCRLGGSGSTAEETKVRILIARLIMARLDAAEKLGLTKTIVSKAGYKSRIIYEEVKANNREYQRKRRNEKR